MSATISDISPAITIPLTSAEPFYNFRSDLRKLVARTRSTREATAAGLAVITTDAPGCRETVVDGENGFLVRVRSAIDIADAMIRYIEEPHLAAKHAMASRELAEQRFDVRIINQHMSGALLRTQTSAAG